MSKFNIYETEWLDLIFKDRNKSYGAYELRKNYSSTLLRSMAVAGIAFLAVFFMAWLTSPKQFINTATAGTSTFVDMSKQIKYERQPGVNRPTNSTAQPSNTAIPVKNDHPGGKHVYPYTNSIPLIHQTHPAEVPVIETPVPLQPVTHTPTQPLDEADEMPLPIGGKNAWADYLKQNLQYPDEAGKRGISGKVRLSFIVEVDGTLSDIKVTQPAGNGFDEEALRVVKASPAWKPGLQNGQPVRVRYSLPINFHIVK